MTKKILALVLAALIPASAHLAKAQQAKVHSVGVILQGGPYYAVIDGLREGLRELGFEEGKHFVLQIRDTKGDLKGVEAARSLVQAKVNLLYTLATSVTIATRGAADIPVVFCVGADPVSEGLVDSIAKPGGRLTGVHFQTRDLTAKRLEIMKEILPKVRRVITFYDSGNRVATEAAKLAREEAKLLGLNFVERHTTSVEELRKALQALKAGEADAYFFVQDAMVVSQAQLIIDTAKAKRLATMFQEGSLVAQGGLASYGLSFYEAGRLSAKYVQRILAGTNPKDLPVETVHKLYLVVNLRTAREIGVTISPNMLARADKVIK